MEQNTFIRKGRHGHDNTKRISFDGGFGSGGFRGKLTFHGVTKNAEMRGTTEWSDHKLVVRGNLDLSLTSFNVERPSLLMIPVQDELLFSLIAVFDCP